MTYNKGKIKRESTQTKRSNPYSKDIIYDPKGQWNHPGQNTRIPGGNITMQGVNYPVMGISDKGDIQMMYPNQEYNFPNAAYVDEFPQMQYGGPIQTGGGRNMHEVLSFQKGGQPKLTPEQIGMMKARLAYGEHFTDNKAFDRMVSPIDNSYQFDDGNTGTHYMSSKDNSSVPLIQDVNGRLVLDESFGPDSKESINFNNPQDARTFAEHYKEVAPVFQKQNGGIINKDMNNDLRRFVYQDGGPSPEEQQMMQQQQAQQQAPEFTEQDQQMFAGFMESLPPEIQQAGEILIEIWMQLGKPPQATQEDVQIIGEALATMQQQGPPQEMMQDPNMQQMPPEAMAQQQAMQQGAPQGMPPQGMMQTGGAVTANINMNNDFSTVSGDDGTLYDVPVGYRNKNIHYRVNPDSTQKRFFKTHQDRMSNFKRAFTPKDKRENFVQQGVYSFQDGGSPFIPNNIMNAAFAENFYMNGGSYQNGGDYQDMELSDAEIADLRAQGYQVDEF